MALFAIVDASSALNARAAFLRVPGGTHHAALMKRRQRELDSDGGALFFEMQACVERGSAFVFVRGNVVCLSY